VNGRVDENKEQTEFESLSTEWESFPLSLIQGVPESEGLGGIGIVVVRRFSNLCKSSAV
jgi:hypothetical protein